MDTDIDILSRIDAVAGRLLVNALHKGDPDGFRHAYKVATLALALTESLNVSTMVPTTAWLGGFFHDVGKLGIPETILNTKGPMTKHDLKYIQRHTSLGKFMLSRLMDSHDIADAALSHHERWDGKGYPHQLKGQDIPLIARIVAIADAYDTMRSAGWLLNHLDHDDVMNRLIAEGGKQFDPNVLKVFIEHSGRMEFTYDHTGQPTLGEVLGVF